MDWHGSRQPPKRPEAATDRVREFFGVLVLPFLVGGEPAGPRARRPSPVPAGTDHLDAMHAISADTSRTLWIHGWRAASMSPVETGGGLVLGGDINGRFRALDQKTGAVPWEIKLGSPVTGFPMTYAVDGRQLVAVSTGSLATASGFSALTRELRPSSGKRFFVFVLPDGD